MSTFREIALAKIEEGIADLQSRGEVLDSDGILAGAMVDAATIAVQDWLRQSEIIDVIPSEPCIDPDLVTRDLICQAGRVDL